MPQPARVIAQDALTRKFLHWDLPVNDLAVQWNLSGPTSITGNFPTDVRDLRDLGLTPWGTWLHLEDDGEIRASGLLQPAQVNTDETLTVDAVGFSAYAKGTPYLGQFTLAGTDPDSGESGVGIGLDPADIVRAIWAEVQAYPTSNLGVTVVGATNVRVGTPAKDTSFTATDSSTGATEDVSFVSGPYSKLDWWEHADCGSEIDALARSTPFDYAERCAWNPARTDVLHWLELGSPRIGSPQSGARFAQAENMAAAVGPEEPDDRYASTVVVIGKGEGSDRVRGEVSRPVPGRLRRVVTVDDKTIESTAAALALARSELDSRQALADITEVTVLARHPNASLGSYSVGDDVTVEGDVPWYGNLRTRQRVLSILYAPNAETAKLTLRAASSFTYRAS